MFALVLDIERYPQFVPGCTHEQILARREISPGCTEIISRMTVGVPPLQFGYTNRTLGDWEARRITVDSTDGPLRSLHVVWQFEPCGPVRTDIGFTADYEFLILLSPASRRAHSNPCSARQSMLSSGGHGCACAATARPSAPKLPVPWAAARWTCPPIRLIRPSFRLDFTLVA